jgi:hypothetical protein
MIEPKSPEIEVENESLIKLAENLDQNERVESEYKNPYIKQQTQSKFEGT